MAACLDIARIPKTELGTMNTMVTQLPDISQRLWDRFGKEAFY
jgi:hypothetical protein